MVREKKPKIIWYKLKDKIIRDIWTLFEKEEEKEERKRKKHNEKKKKDIMWDIRKLKHEKDYHEPKRISNFWNNNYIEYRSNGDKNRNLLLDEYLHKIKPYLRNMIINLQNFDVWKI